MENEAKMKKLVGGHFLALVFQFTSSTHPLTYHYNDMFLEWQCGEYLNIKYPVLRKVRIIGSSLAKRNPGDFHIDQGFFHM